MNPCECPKDGFCQRYQRFMGGRFREICQGVNVDLGTAANLREEWKQKAPIGSYKQPPTPILLKADQAPGDAVAMTAAIYSLHIAHPGRYVTAVESLYPEVFWHNQDVAPLTSAVSMTSVQMHYPAVHQCNDRGIHFMQGWCEHLGRALGMDVPLMTDRPRLYFNEPDPPVENFWLICSGGKTDLTNKLWGHDRYQEVVSTLRRVGVMQFIQVGGNGHHPRLTGAVDMVGRTTLRQLFDLTRRARGVICGVSLLMHVAAALEKPAVVIAGGREPVAWNAYPRQQYVHTVGALPCRDIQGHTGQACWRSRVVPLGDDSVLDQNLCERPIDGVPECMRMIEPDTVAELVLRYDRQYGIQNDSKP